MEENGGGHGRDSTVCAGFVPVPVTQWSQSQLLVPRAHLATSGSCLRSRSRCSVLRKMAQQGKQQSSKMRMPRWSTTPTRFRFLPPKDLEKQHFSKRGDQSPPSSRPSSSGSHVPCSTAQGRGGAGEGDGGGAEEGCQVPDSQLPL